MTSPRSLVRWALSWPETSQQQARRNALVAGTALAQARRERDEVEEFLEALARRQPSVAAARA
jgi:hypothetical protein